MKKIYFEKIEESKHFDNFNCYERYFTGELAQMVERSLRMREARGSMPRFSIFFLIEKTGMATKGQDC